MWFVKSRQTLEAAKDTSTTECMHPIGTIRKQGAFCILGMAGGAGYYEALMGTCNTRKTKFESQSLRALQHQSMQALTNIAAQLLRENWSTQPSSWCCAVPAWHACARALRGRRWYGTCAKQASEAPSVLDLPLPLTPWASCIRPATT